MGNDRSEWAMQVNNAEIRIHPSQVDGKVNIIKTQHGYVRSYDKLNSEREDDVQKESEETSG